MYFINGIHLNILKIFKKEQSYYSVQMIKNVFKNRIHL
jgi:hypothetical protein